MRRTLAPSAEIENQIDQLLAVGVGEHPRQSLSELAKLRARLIISARSRTSSTPGSAGLAELDDMDALLERAGLEICAVHGQLPGGRLEDALDEQRHHKALFLARSLSTTGGR